MNRDNFRAGLRQIFGDGIGIGFADPTSTDHRLMPAEVSAVSKAVPKRVCEFAAGRSAARAALSELGLPAVAIPAAADRMPVWPGGVAGSISHTDTVCLAVVTRAADRLAIGLDVETADPLSRDLWDIVLTPDEMSALDPLPDPVQGQRAKLIFCIKEAAYKAQYPVTQTLFDFQTLAVQMDDSHFRAEFRRDVAPFQSGTMIRGGFFQQDGHVVAGAIIPKS